MGEAISTVGVVGGGMMGAGIAAAAIQAGLSVRMTERDGAAAAAGRARVEALFASRLARQRITQAGFDEALSRLQVAADYAPLADVDLAIEAVFEDMEVKKAVFAQLDQACRPDALLATNTSYLDINEIARSVRGPQRVLGLHFFSPAHVMPLLEVVVAAQTDPQVLAAAVAFGKRLGKVPVRSGVCDGFIGNRMLAVYRAAADHMMEDGASPYQIDRALRDFGFAMGPYQVSDLAGGDIGWATRKRRAAGRDPAARYVQIPDRLCERGWFGQKTARGFYRYPEGSRIGQEDPEVLQVIEDERLRANVRAREFSAAEIVARYMAAMINEGANVLHDGIALQPRDVDTTLLHGYGFPRDKGGPMEYADAIGPARVLADIRRYAEDEPLFWRPSPLLIDLAARGARFASLNHSTP